MNVNFNFITENIESFNKASKIINSLFKSIKINNIKYEVFNNNENLSKLKNKNSDRFKVFNINLEDNLEEKIIEKELGFLEIRFTNGEKEYIGVIVQNLNLIYLSKENSFFQIYFNEYDFLAFKCRSFDLNKKYIFVRVHDDDNLYFSFIENKKNTINCIGETPRIFKSDKIKCLCPIIGKVACSTIIGLFYNLLYNKNYKGQIWRHPYIEAIFNKSKIRLKKNELYNFKDYKKFVILRNPLDRFVSIANYSKSVFNNVGFPYLYKYSYIEDKSKFIDAIIAICYGQYLMENTSYKDEHFMSQSEQLKGIKLENQIDDFVDINYINQYFLNKFNVVLPNINKSKNKFIKKEDISPIQMKRIRRIFNEDFKLYKKTIFWIPNIN